MEGMGEPAEKQVERTPLCHPSRGREICSLECKQNVCTGSATNSCSRDPTGKARGQVTTGRMLNEGPTISSFSSRQGTGRFWTLTNLKGQWNKRPSKTIYNKAQPTSL